MSRRAEHHFPITENTIKKNLDQHYNPMNRETLEPIVATVVGIATLTAIRVKDASMTVAGRLRTLFGLHTPKHPGSSLKNQ